MRSRVLAPVAVWLGVAAVVLPIQLVRAHGSFARVVDAYRGSGGDYLYIARHGYPPETWRIGWYPGYPFLVRGAHAIGIGSDVAAAAVLVAIVAALVAMVAFWDWMTSLGVTGLARTLGAAALLLSPAGFVLVGIAYSEGLFLAFAIGACAAVERRRPWVAAGLLVAATATRFAGVPVAIALALRMAELDGAFVRHRGRTDRRRFRPVAVDWGKFAPRHLVPLLGVAGTVGFFAYSWRYHDSPFAYFHIQRELVPSPPLTRPGTWIHTLFFKHFGTVTREPGYFDAPGYFIASVINLIMTVLVACTIPSVARRFGFAYGVYVALIVAMIWFAAWDFSSGSRYLLAAFPVAALVGEKLVERKRTYTVYAACGAVAMLASDYSLSYLA